MAIHCIPSSYRSVPPPRSPPASFPPRVSPLAPPCPFNRSLGTSATSSSTQQVLAQRLQTTPWSTVRPVLCPLSYRSRLFGWSGVFRCNRSRIVAHDPVFVLGAVWLQTPGSSLCTPNTCPLPGSCSLSFLGRSCPRNADPFPLWLRI